MMPSSKRSRPKAPAAGSVYKDNVHANAAPFTPAPVDKNVDSRKDSKGDLPESDETGTGKCQGA